MSVSCDVFECDVLKGVVAGSDVRSHTMGTVVDHMIESFFGIIASPA